MKRREKEREEEVDAGRRGGGGSDKYIFVLCSVVADGFSFNVSCEERRLEDFFFPCFRLAVIVINSHLGI